MEWLPIKYSSQKPVIFELIYPLNKMIFVFVEHNKFFSILKLIKNIEAHSNERLRLLQVTALGFGDVCDGTQYDVDVAGWNPV